MIQKIKNALDIYIYIYIYTKWAKNRYWKEGNNLNLVAFQPIAISKVRWQNI